MPRNNIDTYVKGWETFTFPCAGQAGGYMIDLYRSGPEAIREFGEGLTALCLQACGYCALPDCDTIVRIDRTEWLKEGKRAAPGEFIWSSLPRLAAHYRRGFSKDRINNVPRGIRHRLPNSDDAPDEVEIRLKNSMLKRFEELTAAQVPEPAEEFPVTITQQTNEQTTALALETVPMKVVLVTFPNKEDKEYAYFAPASAVVGDYCVVYATGNHMNSQLPFMVGTIVNETPDIEGRARAAILGTFNEAFAKHVQARMDTLASIKAKLQQKKKQFEEAKFFEMMAQSDPEARELLDQLKQFNI